MLPRGSRYSTAEQRERAAANPAAAAAGKLNVPTAVCVKESSEQQSTACLETAADESLDTYSRHLNVDYKLESLISSSE